MIFQKTKCKTLFLLLSFFLSVCLCAQIPAGYYQPAIGKTTAELKTALYKIITQHKMLEYYSSSTSFRSTDWHPATTDLPGGYFWDMYSNNKRTVWSGMNREHSLPKSWFGIASGAENSAAISTDLHNLYPSDAAANTAKSNYPLGEVAGSPQFSNGVVKVGASGFPGYLKTVFEPADEYKGDFARDYMYMVTCYEDYSTRWQSMGTASMLLKNTYPVFNTYAVSLLLKWHRNDPVSLKETTRNDAVYALQENRNPFVDHPELAEFIWGKFMGEPWKDDGVLPEGEVGFSLFPNPVSDVLVVKLNSPEKSLFRIKNLKGVVLKTGSFSEQGTLPVDELENGVYVLEVYAANMRKQVAKFVVVHSPITN